MHLPERYEKLAAEHRATAARAAHPALKDALLKVAENYEAMAQRVRRIEALIPTER